MFCPKLYFIAGFFSWNDPEKMEEEVGQPVKYNRRGSKSFFNQRSKNGKKNISCMDRYKNFVIEDKVMNDICN